MMNATSGGNQTQVWTPETEKETLSQSMCATYPSYRTRNFAWQIMH
jgi:hypothetical protein